MAQQQEKELQLNMDAVKMIQFDFNPTSKPKKPEGYVRMEPYTIWTRFGEDPVYDVLVTGRPKKWEISWTLNPNQVYRDENYGRSLMPSTGRMYESVGGSAGVGIGLRP